MKMAKIRLGAWIKIVVSTLLLSSCGGGGSADDNCTPTTNVSTTLQTEVDINGNVSLVPVANNTVSGCGSSSEIGDHFDSDRITTRIETTEDFDVWDCSRTDGSSLQYALFSYDDFENDGSYGRYAFEIDPGAEDLQASQQLYAWRVFRSPSADTITFWTREKMGPYSGGIESEWTGITFATEDDVNFTSSIKGAMQCHRTVSVVDLAASRFDIPCKYRGPVSACPSDR